MQQKSNYIKNIEWEVLTPDGWSDFDGVKKVNKKYYFEIKLVNQNEIKCSGGHQLFILRDNETGFLFADLIEETDKVQCSDGEFYPIASIKKVTKSCELYDLVNVKKAYKYYTNNILSHNCAHVEDIEQLWLGLRPTLSTGGNAILLSTPSGVGTLFHKIWISAKEGDGDFYPIELPWQVHPDRDEEWFEKEKKSIIKAVGERGVAQELLCLDGDTDIITFDGCKNIKNIKVGDKVLTHKGRFRNVKRVYKHKLFPNEKMYSVSTPGNRKKPIKITFNHPILSYQFKVPKGKNNKTHFQKLLNSQGLTPNFECIYNINNWKYTTNSTRRVVYGCFFPHMSYDNLLVEQNKRINKIDLSKIGVSNREITEKYVSYNKQKKNIRTNRFVNIDYNLGRLVGLYAAEGHSESNRIGFTFHHNEYHTLGKFVREMLTKIGCNYYDNMHNYSKCYTILTCNKYIRKLLNTYVIPGNARTKHYNFEQLIHTSPEFIRGIIVGHFEGDGGHPVGKSLENKIKVVCKSKKMLYQLKIIMSLYGLYPRIGFINDEPSYLEVDGLTNLPRNKRNIFHLTQQTNTKLSLNKSTSRTVLIENQYFVGAMQWDKLVIPEHYGDKYPTVYNIEVEEDNSYIADSLIVHNCSFMASGDTFIKSDVMERLFKKIREPITVYGPEGNGKRDTWVWAHPKTNHKYIICADVARGDGADFSAFHVIDIDDDEVVAEYKGKIQPDKFAEVLVEMGNRYNMALICSEKNNVGIATAYKLKDTNYPNLYYEKFHKNVYMVYTSTDIKDQTPGIETTVKNRLEMLVRLQTVLRNGALKVYSKRLYDELQTCIWKGNKPQAQKGYNDDLIMALAIGNSLFEAGGTTTYGDEDMAKALLAGMSVTTNTMEGHDELNHRQPGQPIPPIVTDGTLNDFVTRHKLEGMAASGTHDYHDPLWQLFGWVYKN